jgi:hypothetical protein
MPNVTVELKNVATGAVRTTISTAEGIFRLNSVQPDVYDLTVKAGTGFRDYIQRQITGQAQAGDWRPPSPVTARLAHPDHTNFSRRPGTKGEISTLLRGRTLLLCLDNHFCFALTGRPT